MRIAQIAPLHESVPPELYGGTERVVSFLTEELVAQGHDVTLFASGDSRTRARLVPGCQRALRLDPDCHDVVSPHVLLVELAVRQAEQFDLLHFHSEPYHYPLVRRCRTPAITTLHGRLDLRELNPLYREFREVKVVSISDDQRRPLPELAWQGTVHHGLPLGLYDFCDRPGSYLAFLGRVSPEKGPTAAIAIARRAGLPLKIAAKIAREDQEYYQREVEPLLGGDVEFVGEVDDHHKGQFLGNALGLLFPIEWPEPFGLVMIEAMACGTPVVAYRRGSVPEVMEDGVTGFIVDDEAAAVGAVGRLRSLDRHRIREQFEKRFSVSRMARDYVDIYRRQVR